jgi:hypothetical protein
VIHNFLSFIELNICITLLGLAAPAVAAALVVFGTSTGTVKIL